MAEVFRAKRLGACGFERTVVIKRILPGLAREERFVRMFIREALILGRMIHPNIVAALGFERDPDDQLCLVLEFVDGVDLAHLIKGGPLSPEVTAFIVGEILRGLAHAHQLPLGDGVLGADARGVVHRDLSPHNILLSWDGAVKVADFGLAKVRDGSRVSASRDFHGKVAYMSPEQINGEALDGRSDLFAVGVMMWEMLTGARLFQSDSAGSTIWRVLTELIIRPGVLRPVPTDLEAIAMRLLERDPGRRFPSAEAAFDALASCDCASSHGHFDLERLLVTRFPRWAIRRQLLQPSPGKMIAHRRPWQTVTAHSHLGDRTVVGMARLQHWLCYWWPTIAILMILALAGCVLLRPANLV